MSDMKPLTEAQMLSLTERTRPLNSLQRAVAVLIEAGPIEREKIWEMSIGEINRHLLRVRQRTLGDAMPCQTACPQCNAALEFSLSAAGILASLTVAVPKPQQVKLKGYQIGFNKLRCGDVLGAIDAPDLDEARDQLLGRCITKVRKKGATLSVDELPDSLREQLLDRIVQADPATEINLNLRCPECAHHWKAVFDIADYFWEEISHMSTQLIWQVHLLAKNYGWREEDVLQVSPARRKMYLEMCYP